jgi:hypothetical protein
VGIKRKKSSSHPEAIRPQSHLLHFSIHLFVDRHETPSNVLHIASLDGVLEVDSAERVRASALALDGPGAGGAVVLVLVGAGAFAYLVSLIRQSYHRRRGKADKSGPSHRRVERERMCRSNGIRRTSWQVVGDPQYLPASKQTYLFTLLATHLL